jgi:NAD(P)-dependent dehydrogenase (short-subunit alcohol dehydrogenase family)
MTEPALLIVGATHGLGKEIARRYAGQGWAVVLTGRDGSAAKSVATELGGDTRGIALDLSEPELVADALADVGAVDHVVLAAIARDTNTLADYDLASARYLVTMKLLGYTAVIGALRDRLVEDGSIVLFGGRAKDRPYPGGMTVGTVNAGITGLMHALVVQLAPRRVNAIHPGIVANSPYWSENPGFPESVRKATPTGRSVTMEDIIDGVDFLIRNKSVNGLDLYVDGGWLVP